MKFWLLMVAAMAGCQTGAIIVDDPVDTDTDTDTDSDTDTEYVPVVGDYAGDYEGETSAVVVTVGWGGEPNETPCAGGVVFTLDAEGGATGELSCPAQGLGRLEGVLEGAVDAKGIFEGVYAIRFGGGQGIEMPTTGTVTLDGDASLEFVYESDWFSIQDGLIEASRK